MIRLGKQSEVEEYFEREAASQSFLKLLLAGVDFLNQNEKNLYYEEKGHFIIGSGVDSYITQGQQEFESQYYYADTLKPTEKVMSIVQMVYDRLDTHPLLEYDRLLSYRDHILEASNEHAYQSKWLDDTRINKIIETGSDYFQELIESSGKQILSKAEDLVISNIVMSFRTHKHTAHYFRDSQDIDILYQVPIYFNHNGVNCKALLDMVIINRRKKLIQIVDLKTMGDIVTKFPKAVKDRGYNIQAAFYTQAMEALINGQASSSVRELGILGDYQILPFRFIVETTNHKINKVTGDITTYQGKPMVYRLSGEQMVFGKKGRDALYPYFGGHRITFPAIRGFEQALELYKWHQENGFEYDKEVFENNGELLI